jgi:hypothetical protein
MPHHRSATSEELSVEGPSAPPTTLDSHALGKQQVAFVNQQIALVNQLSLQQANASSHCTLGKRAFKKQARFEEAEPENAINKKGNRDEPKASSHGKSAQRPSTGEEMELELPSALLPSASKDTQSTRVQRTGKRAPARLRDGEENAAHSSHDTLLSEVRPAHSRLQKRCPLGPDFSLPSVVAWVKVFLPLAGCNTARPRAAG